MVAVNPSRADAFRTRWYEYAPYGERTVYVSPGSNDPDCHTPTLLPQRVKVAAADQPYAICDVGFQGKLHDDATGLVHHWYREWHPRFAVWNQRDPLGYPVGLNAYAGYHALHGLHDASGLLPDIVYQLFGMGEARAIQRAREQQRDATIAALKNRVVMLTTQISGIERIICDCELTGEGVRDARDQQRDLIVRVRHINEQIADLAAGGEGGFSLIDITPEGSRRSAVDAFVRYQQVGGVGNLVEGVSHTGMGIMEIVGIGKFLKAITGPSRGTFSAMDDIMEAISKNADEAVALARQDALAGQVKNTAQAIGSRAHAHFERLNAAINETLERCGSPFRIAAEEFRDATGQVVSRRASGSIGADVIVKDMDGGTLRIFDLKTFVGNNPTAIDAARQQQFFNRFGSRVDEIFRSQ